MRQLLLLSLLTPSTTVAHEKQSLDMHTAIQTPVCDSMSDTSKASCRVSRALGFIFVYSSFVCISLCTVTYWSIKKKMEKLGPAHSSAPPLTVSSFASLWCSANAYFICDDADQEGKPQFLRLLETIVLIECYFWTQEGFFFPLHKQVCGFEGSCSSLCGKCLKTNHKKLEQNQLLPPL